MVRGSLIDVPGFGSMNHCVLEQHQARYHGSVALIRLPCHLFSIYGFTAHIYATTAQLSPPSATPRVLTKGPRPYLVSR